MNTKTTKVRRDPLTEIVDYDCLKLAFDLMANSQDYNYWTTVKSPKEPQGRVPYEGLRQIATFLLPATFLFLLWFYVGPYATAFALIPILFLGYWLDRSLQKDIQRQLRFEQNLDRGRYAVTYMLADRLGLDQDEITLARIHKMAIDFMNVDSSYRQASVENAVKATQSARVMRQRGYEDARKTIKDANATRVIDSVDEDGVITFFNESAPSFSINPATGMPMIENTSIDVLGNVYGTHSAHNPSDFSDQNRNF